MFSDIWHFQDGSHLSFLGLLQNKEQFPLISRISNTLYIYKLLGIAFYFIATQENAI